MKTTSDYSKFRFFEWNREINTTNLKQKIDSIQRAGYIDGNPIICSMDMYKKTGLYYVIDGQHRLTALKKLGLEVPYIFIEGDPVHLVKELNASQKAWQVVDFLNMWVKQGLPKYIKLQKFIDENGFKTVVGISIALNMTDGCSYVGIIKLGHDFEFNPRAQEIADYIKTSNVPHCYNTNFIRACCILFRKANDKQLKKLHYKLIAIPQLAQTSQYLRAFENIINKNTQSCDKISL